MEFANRYKVVGYTKDSIRVFVSIMDKEPTIKTLESFVENYTLKIAYFEITQIMQVAENEIEKHNFTDNELNILQNIYTEYNYIARDNNRDLYLYETKPSKGICSWSSGKPLSFGMYNNIFKDIMWENEEPVKIDDYVNRS